MTRQPECIVEKDYIYGAGSGCPRLRREIGLDNRLGQVHCSQERCLGCVRQVSGGFGTDSKPVDGWNSNGDKDAGNYGKKRGTAIKTQSLKLHLSVFISAMKQNEDVAATICLILAMDSSVATDPNNAKDYTDVQLERTMNSIEKEVAADVGSSEEKLSEKKQNRIKLVGTKGKGEKVEKGLKEKQKIKLEETKSSNEGEDLKSHVYGTLHSRMSPSSIVQVIEKCSENQLKAIRAIGFGSIEFLKVTQLPLQLGLWLVHHFDANTCSLNILDYEPFCITEEHVHQVLGLPMGGIEIDKNNFSRDKRVIQQWKKQFKSNSLSIKIGELKEFLKEHNSAGLMFKRNFVVLCVSSLMDGKLLIFSYS
uniref:Uncharacterized protein n=1 Tax=Chenopodium quinoa TaxID=63459 RepID=A0A803MPT5_CHEQI